jgi:hypothetical protein
MKSLILATLVLLAASRPTAAEPPVHAWHVVLIAGDGSIRAFDNATKRMADWLQKTGNVPKDSIIRLSATPAAVSRGGAVPATIYNVAKAVTQMRPAAGEACLVFITSHGLPEGVALTWKEEILGPRLLDGMLTAGCGDAPTVAIVSACYSGSFAAAPTARGNRIVFTAARPDRASFGCGASEVYTFFDKCLLGALSEGERWVDVFDDVRTCVKQREARGKNTPSEPQIFVGSEVADLTLPR